jgi:hypothetical protein
MTTPSNRPQFVGLLGETPAQSRRKASMPGYIALVALLIGVGGWLAFSSFRTTDNSLADSTKTANQFLADMASGQDAAAASLLSDTATENNSATSLRQTMTELVAQNGPYYGATLVYSAPRTIAGLQTCKLSYNLKFQAKIVHADLILVQSYPNWRVDSFVIG